ncbi:hypothetical protein SPSPH_027670 [Sporomusa sphaeroides DSM 2875]|uniref:Uncharacterized protein n=3 Tax=Sporomusa TaxID=2375 RepID=A0ABM9W5G9_9FIRM|nr:hypothetical protein [uncultured Sporomusa sp.]OLS55657.1 hypothetical protein SPSPH_29860 [Sporomusa sphaeroides DSM 2875]CVK19417.1 hypothetical protein SSPH_02068 [Sporomusa sphaeroides DSM 2875]SCM78906.1 conserved hypothetical protein [uncultured Sporomusa sp.]
MTEGTKAELFLSYLDRILAGETDLGPVADGELAGLIRLAQSMVAADLSSNSKIRESLRQQLLGRLSPTDTVSLAAVADDGRPEGELTEAELELVTAAGAGVGTVCPRCGASEGGRQGKCPCCR